MLRHVAQRVLGCAAGLEPCTAPALSGYVSAFTARAAATKAADAGSSSDPQTVFAQYLYDEAAKAKKQDALKDDVMKLIGLLEDSSPENDADKPFKGALKDGLGRLGKRARSDLFSEFLNELEDPQPVFKEIVQKLAVSKEPESLMDIAYKYMELATGQVKQELLSVKMVLPSDESKADVDDKKAMLVADMTEKGLLAKGQQVDWTVAVDPSIKGGVVYHVGDLLVDCSVKSLEDEFFQSLAVAGFEKVAVKQKLLSSSLLRPP
eukprot:TRINITY_DN9842_c0_g2_i4.p1 TRINITY_DN9842_c0_g2~~TRINITY_DN9842_c0_g2_i4.p1  ORF type:complete len:264 (-),score=40.19 TRINITY_DN9842_c0_g2_i4:155-946(-)